MAVVKKPVPVVVLGGGPAFAERLVACLGDDRVRAVAVGDDGGLRKAVFAYTPLLVIVDAVSPSAVEIGALASALRGLPDVTLAVMWGAETTAGSAMLPA